MEDRSKSGPFRRKEIKESYWKERFLFSGSIILFIVFVTYFIFSQKALNKYFELEEELEDFAIFKNDSLCNITSVEYSVGLNVIFAYLQLIGLVALPLLNVLLTCVEGNVKAFHVAFICLSFFKNLSKFLSSFGAIAFCLFKPVLTVMNSIAISIDCFEENSDFDSLFEPLRKAAFIDYSITIFLVLSCCPFFLYFGSNKN